MALRATSFNTVLVLVLLLIARCKAYQNLPNVGYLGVGYDILFGNPRSIGSVDPGFRSPIYDLTSYSPDHLSPDQQYAIPNGIEVTNCTSCSLSFSSSEIHSAFDYLHQLKEDVSVDLSFWGAAFSASADYQKIATGSHHDKSVFVLSRAQCQIYCANILPETSPALSLNFRNAIASLPIHGDDKSAYHALVKDFGTHFTQQIRLGGKFGQLSEFSTSSWSSLVQTAINVKTAASSSAFQASGSVSVMTDDEKRLAQTFSQTATSQSFFSVGGDLPTDGNVFYWIASSTVAPLPIQYTLRSITQLLSSQHFPTDPHIATKHQLLSQFLVDYCSMLVAQHVIHTCEPPQPTSNDPYRDMLVNACHNHFALDGSNWRDSCGCDCQLQCLGQRAASLAGCAVLNDMSPLGGAMDTWEQSCARLSFWTDDCGCQSCNAECLGKTARAFLKCN